MTNAVLDALDPYRLPRHALPKRYDVRLEPRLADAAFDGTVAIEVELTEATDTLVLNACDLVIHGARLDGVAASTSLLEADERLVVTSAAPIGPGTVELAVDFTGVLNDKLKGFYRSTFTDADGVEHTIATSQMQATDCRRAFPCWDEPDFKAVFAATLVVEPGLLAISNGPEISRETLDDGRVAVRFDDTMPMSTYLVAFVVGPLETTHTVDAGGVPLRVVHLPGKGHLAGFSLDLAARGLQFFHDYYGIPYADQKIDLVAIPDFAAGAMENTGCITFRENLLLVDPATATLNEQMVVADVVLHELAHMWFGNLVTMRWWNGIWLNEAFATFMEVESSDGLLPEWKRWEVFSLERSAAFDTDSLASTRPIEFPVHSPADCEGMFDVLTYQKGGAILRMLQQYLGAERFRDGVRHYLATHSYSNTETGDLWDAIEHVVSADGGNEPVRELMDSWVWQPGYPLISASLDGNSLVLTQQRFGFDDETTSDPATWLVPLHLRIGGAETKLLLAAEPARIELDDPSSTIVVNAGGHGFLRVAYSPELLGRLQGSALRQLGAVERYMLVDDAWNATVAGTIAASDLLGLLRGFSEEDDLSVWQAVIASFTGLMRLVEGDALDALRGELRAVLAPELAQVGWEPAEGEGDRVGRVRGMLVTALAVHGADADARARCAALFEASEADPESVHPELAAAAISSVAATGDEATYDRLVQGFLHGRTPQEQIRKLYALAELPTAELIEKVCHFAFSGSVRTQNAPFVLNLCIANREHGGIAWRVVRENWDKANELFPSNTIPRMIGMLRQLNKPEIAADVQAFFGEHGIPQAAKTLDQILERQRVNVALREREEVTFGRFLTGENAG